MRANVFAVLLFLTPVAQAAVHVNASFDVSQIDMAPLEITGFNTLHVMVDGQYKSKWLSGDEGALQLEVHDPLASASAVASSNELTISASAEFPAVAKAQASVQLTVRGSGRTRGMVRIPYHIYMTRDQPTDIGYVWFSSVFNSGGITVPLRFVDDELMWSSQGIFEFSFDHATPPISNLLTVSATAQPVPEPSTYALLGLGVFSIPITRRFRRRRLDTRS